MSCWYCGSILVSNTKVGRFKPFYCYYRLQRSWAKVMFLQASVILLTGGCLPQCMLGYTPPRSRHPPGADTPQEQTPPKQTPPEEQTHPPSRHPSGEDTPPKQTPAYGQRANGTHPTGMHSCDKYFCHWIQWKHLGKQCLSYIISLNTSFFKNVLLRSIYF